MTEPVDPQTVEAIRARYEVVKLALRDNEIDIWNRDHHARWDDIDTLLRHLAAVEQARDALCKLNEASARHHAREQETHCLEVVRRKHAEAERDALAAELRTLKAQHKELKIQMVEAKSIMRDVQMMGVKSTTQEPPR